MLTLLNLSIDSIEDKKVQEAFFNIREFVSSQPLLLGEFDSYEISFIGAVTNFKSPHHLLFVPKDIIQTSKIGAGNITFNYALFDRTNFDITTTGACVVRFLAGNISPRSPAV